MQKLLHVPVWWELTKELYLQETSLTVYQYMVILFLLFLFQFSIACACLAVNAEQRSYFANQAWTAASEKSLTAVQNKYDCCGYSDPIKFPHPSCVNVSFTSGKCLACGLY